MDLTRNLSMRPNTSSLHELLDISDPGTTYHIPLYQRDYTWRTEDVTDFLRDARESYKANSQRFFGTILLSENAPQFNAASGDAVFYVIDGQQRLTTVLLTLAAMRHIFLEFSHADTQALQSAIRLSDRLTVGDHNEHRQPRLYPNQATSEFTTFVLGEGTTSYLQVHAHYASLKPKAIQRRCRPVMNAYENCYRFIRDMVVAEVKGFDIGDASDGTLSSFISDPADITLAVQTLKDFQKHFLRNSIVVKITISDWKESFELFDGLNNRGMELAKKDVLKNIVLSRAARQGPKNVTDVEAKWQEFEDLAENFDFTRFLRHWMLLEHREVTLGGATRMFAQITDTEAAHETVARLIEAAHHYVSIVEPSAARVANIYVRRHLENLKTLSAERIRPIVLAAMLRSVPDKSLREILSSLEVLYFRRSAICQQDNKSLEVAVQKIAATLFAEGNSALPKVLSDIRQLNPSDDIFRSMFVSKSGMPHAAARYLLLSIENYLRDAKKLPPIDGSDVTLEHIMPQKPETHWGQDPKRPEVRDLIGRIGNLTLLRGKENSESNNQTFVDKKAFYGDPEEALFISRDILTLDSWGAGEIDARQINLADTALKVWAVVA